jgi:hexosaminidase
MMSQPMKFVLFAAISFFTATAFAADTNELALIPLPQKVQRLDGSFTLTPQTHIYADWSSRKTANLIVVRMRKSTGYPLKIRHSSTPHVNAILFTTQNANPNLGPEGYELIVTTNSIVIRAPTQAGLFYGGQTLLQLLPAEVFSSNVVTANWQVPCVDIEDWPRFQWRGLMLDVSRHFFNKSEVEAILDEMAFYKLNFFHWHLTDDQGWRIQIKKYPKLTEIGAWRGQVNFVAHSNETFQHPAWSQPTPDKFASDSSYGGFYTQKDIRDVVACAAARHITIVPEIEMPGHAEAALAAYPQYSCVSFSGNDLRGHKGIYDPSNPETFVFLDNILCEVFELFPGPYVHIGGDEVQTNYWHDNTNCQALMKREGLADEHALQSWFTARMEKYINAHGKTLVGWSEILRGGLPTNAVVMDWIGGAKDAAKTGHDAVMAPSEPIPYCYFDYYQSTNHATEPRAIGKYLPLRQVYSFEPMPAGLPAEFQSHILGAQGNLWTEYVPSLSHAQYMIFPRECAMAEVTWSAPDARNWDDFYQRLMANEKCLDELGVNYRPGGDEPIVAPTARYKELPQQSVK